LIGSTTGNHIVEPFNKNDDGLAEIGIPPEVSGLHELIFTGKSAFVLFYHVHMCVQCEILVIWLLHLSLHCIHLFALATHMY